MQDVPHFACAFAFTGRSIAILLKASSHFGLDHRLRNKKLKYMPCRAVHTAHMGFPAHCLGGNRSLFFYKVVVLDNLYVLFNSNCIGTGFINQKTTDIKKRNRLSITT